MDEDQKAVEDFLGDLKDDGQKDPLTSESDDPFASIEQEEKGNQTEEVEPELKDKVEKPLPFNKDPKIQRFIDKQVEKALANRPEPTQAKEVQEDYFDGVIKAFEGIIGNDTPEKVTALNSLRNSLSTLEERTLSKSEERAEARRQGELAIEQEYENKLTDGFETIEEETGIDLYAPQNKKLRVRFIDFVEKVAPKENGEISELPDIGETFKAFQSMYKPQSQTPRAKELASKSMERSGEVTQQKDTGRISWDNVGEKIMEGLGM